MKTANEDKAGKAPAKEVKSAVAKTADAASGKEWEKDVQRISSGAPSPSEIREGYDENPYSAVHKRQNESFDPEDFARKIKSLAKTDAQAPSLTALVESINTLPGFTARLDHYNQSYDDRSMSRRMAETAQNRSKDVLHLTIDRDMAEATARYLYDAFSKI